MKVKSSLWQMFYSMLMIGCIGFGGGNALIPVIYKRVVEDDKLVSAEEYESDVVVASITPGALPVEIASGVGRRLWGAWGAVAGATGMALPGAIMTVLGLALYYLLDQDTVLQIKYATIGISAYIAFLLSCYVQKTFAEKKMDIHWRWKFFLALAVFLATCGKNVYLLLGIKRAPMLGLATIHVFILTFFVLCFMQVRWWKYIKYALAVLLCAIYSLCVMRFRVITDENVLTFVKGVMAVLAVWGIICSKNAYRSRFLIPWKECIRELSVLLGILLATIIAGVMFYPAVIEFAGKGIMSSLISFGGGDAYLAVADAMFVEGGTLADSVFYGELVPLVNILPGSILCKTMSGVGYLVGMSAGGSITAYIMSAVGFVCSIVASCGVFSFIGCLYRALGELPLIQSVQRWIRPIVSGLMLTVILALVRQVRCIDSSSLGWFFVVLMIAIYMLNMVLQRCGVIGVKCVIFDLLVAMIACNLM